MDMGEVGSLSNSLQSIKGVGKVIRTREFDQRGGEYADHSLIDCPTGKIYEPSLDMRNLPLHVSK